MQPVEREQRIITTNYSRKLNEIRHQWEDGWKCIHEKELTKGKVTLVFEKIVFKDPQERSREFKSKFHKVKETLDKCQFKME